MLRRMLLASSLAAGIVLWETPPAPALIPVEDYAAITRLFQQVQQLQQMLNYAFQQVHALTNIPNDLIRQADGLLTLGIQNPLGDLQNTLSSIMNGGPLTGTCAAAASGLINANRYSTATGADFAGALLNANSSRLGGVMACMNTQMHSTQERLNQMPQLLSQLQSCTDVACATAVSGSIQYQTALIQTQTNQAILMGQAAQAQRWSAEDQVNEKIRADAEGTVQGTSGNGAGQGGPVAMTPQAPAFAAPPAGG